MEIKNNLLEINEDVKSEMEKILWTPEETIKDNKNIEVEVRDSKTDDNQIDIKENVVEEENKINEAEKTSTPKNTKKEEKEEKKEKKPRNVAKGGNANWFESIPDNERLQPGDIICLTVDNLNKFGEFIEYGKKQGIYWVNMRKKDSLELMSKKWSVKDFECEVVFHNGELNPKYTVDDKGIYRIK